MTIRFVVLLVAGAALTITIGDALWYHVRFDEELATVTRCSELAADAADFSATYAECTRPTAHRRVAWSVGGGVAVLLAAGVAGAIGSGLRRRRTVPVPLDALPAAGRLNAEVGGAAPLQLRWRPHRHITTARADGIVRPYIEVSPRFLALASAQPTHYTAVLEHEYAHHRTHDIVASRWTEWSVFTLAVPVVVGAAYIIDEGVDEGVLATGRILIALLAVAAARAAALRTREHAADTYVVRRGQGDSLHAALRPVADDVAPRRAWWRRAIDAVFASHPPVARRRAVVEDPRLLDVLSPLDGAIVGATAAIAAPVLERVISSWTQTGDVFANSSRIAWSAIGVLLSGWIVAVIAAARRSNDGPLAPRTLASFAGGLAGGVLVGQWWFSKPVQLGVRPLPRTTIEVVGLLAVAVVIAGFIVWVAAIAGADRGSWHRWLRLVVAASAGAVAIGIAGKLAADSLVIGTVDAATPIDPNGPIDVARFVWLSLPTWAPFALGSAALLVHVLAAAIDATTTRRSPRRRAASLGAAIVGSALVSGVFYWLVIDVFDVVERSVERGWYPLAISVAAVQIAVLLPGVAAASLVSNPTAERYSSRVLAITALTAFPAAASTLIVDRLDTGRWQSGDVWVDRTRDVLALALVVASLVAIGALVRQRWLRHRWSFRLAGWCVALGAFVALAAALAPKSTPAVAIDVQHENLAVPADDIIDVLFVSCAGPITPEAIPLLDGFVDLLSDPAGQPTVDEVRTPRRHLVDMIADCRRVTAEAVAQGQPQAQSADARWPQLLCTFGETGAPIGIEFAIDAATVCNGG